MGFSQEPQAGNATRSGKLMPGGVFDRMERHSRDDHFKQCAQSRHVRERRGIAAISLDDPLASAHVCSIAPFHTRDKTSLCARLTFRTRYRILFRRLLPAPPAWLRPARAW